MKNGSPKEVVANEWLGRIAELLGRSDVADSPATTSFLVAFQKALYGRFNDSLAGGHRNLSSKAIEAGIKEMVKAVLRRPPDDKCFSVKPDKLIKKTADVSFTMSDGRRLVFEVKTALEFNPLAAAATEGILFRKFKDPKEKITFVLFSLAGKNYDASRASQVLKLISETTSPVDKVFVLSPEAGKKPRGRDPEKILGEVVSSLAEFEKYLKTFQ